MAQIVSHQSPGFSPCSVYVIFVITLRRDFPGSVFPPLLPTNFNHNAMLNRRKNG